MQRVVQHRHKQWPPVISELCFVIRAVTKQYLDGSQVLLDFVCERTVNSDQKRSSATVVYGFDVGASLEQQLQDCFVASTGWDV